MKTSLASEEVDIHPSRRDKFIRWRYFCLVLDWRTLTHFSNRQIWYRCTPQDHRWPSLRGCDHALPNLQTQILAKFNDYFDYFGLARHTMCSLFKGVQASRNSVPSLQEKCVNLSLLRLNDNLWISQTTWPRKIATNQTPLSPWGV